jgi:hypothetical protein
MPLPVKLLEFCLHPDKEGFAIRTLSLPQGTDSLCDFFADNLAVLRG